MKRLIVIIITCFLLTACINTVSTDINNELVHKAYENAIRNGELDYIRKCAMEYAFYDINNDGLDEFIAYPASGACTYAIYNFCDGKIKELMAIGQAGSILIYPGKSAFSFINSGHMDAYSDVFYQLTDKNANIVAEHDFRDEYSNEELINTEHEYIVNEKVTTEIEYKNYIDNLSAGKTVNHESLRWSQWLNQENSDWGNSSILQLNERDTHYLRFDSKADNSIIFHFNVHDYGAKLNKAEIRVLDLNLKPISETDSFSAFEQKDYKCKISEAGGYYLEVTSEFNKSNQDYLSYEVYIANE